MSIFGSFKRALAGLKRKIKLRQIVQLRDSDFRHLASDSKNVEALKKKMRALEEARGYAEGEKAYQTAKAKKYESLLRAKKTVNVSEILHKRAKHLKEQQFKGGFNWRKFYRELEKNEKKYNLYSYNLKKKFGRFHSHGILTDGRTVVYVKNKGKIRPLIVGRTPKDIFRNFSGLNNTVGKGIIAVNLNENGEYFENIEEREVPNVILDGNGNIAVTRFDLDSFIRRLAEKTHIINSLVEKYKPLEKMIATMSIESQIKEIGENLALKRAEEYESIIGKQIHEIAGMMGNYHSMQQQLMLSANQQKVYEEMANQWQGIRDKLFEKISKVFPEEQRESIKKEIKKDMQDMLDHLKDMAKASAKQISSQQQPPPLGTPRPVKPRI